MKTARVSKLVLIFLVLLFALPSCTQASQGEEQPDLHYYTVLYKRESAAHNDRPFFYTDPTTGEPSVVKNYIEGSWKITTLYCGKSIDMCKRTLGVSVETFDVSKEVYDLLYDNSILMLTSKGWVIVQQ